MLGGSFLLTCLMLVPNAGAADGIAFNRADFELPVTLRDATKVKSLIVWVSTDDGKTWAPAGFPFSPDKQRFNYNAPNDGIYYFSISTIDFEGRQTPNDPTQLKVMQRVLVDRQPPVMHITNVDRTDQGVTVKWDVKEDHPSPESFKLLYQVQGSNEWTLVAGAELSANQANFRPNGEVTRVRIEMLDVANNQGMDEKNVLPIGGPVVSGSTPRLEDRGEPVPPVSPIPVIPPARPVLQRTGGTASWGEPNPVPAPSQFDPGIRPVATSSQPGMGALASSGPGSLTEMPRPASSQLPPLKYVNSRRVNLKYKVEQLGSSGIAGVELYLTRDDGRSWILYGGEQNISTPVPTDPKSAGPLQQTLTIELPGEGLYGTFLVLRSGTGYRSSDAPKSGDAPQQRLMVDVTPPVVDLFALRPDTAKRDTVVISWRGLDANPSSTPILLEWAEQEAGEWHLIGPGELANTGSYTWTVPSSVPPRVFLRVTMRDLAGNVAVAQTSEPQDLDLKPPKLGPMEVESVPDRRQ